MVGLGFWGMDGMEGLHKRTEAVFRTVVHSMKKAHHHTPVKEPLAKHRATPSHARKQAGATRAKKLTAPIFNTSLAGKLIKYERPFDPVWPSEEEE